MRACHNCLHWDVCSVREDDIACGIYKPKEKRNVKPQNNADRIRAMTDDELNDLFHDIYDSGVYDAVSYGCGHQTNSFEWTMDWLQQPAEGE